MQTIAQLLVAVTEVLHVDPAFKETTIIPLTSGSSSSAAVTALREAWNVAESTFDCANGGSVGLPGSFRDALSHRKYFSQCVHLY